MRGIVTSIGHTLAKAAARVSPAGRAALRAAALDASAAVALNRRKLPEERMQHARRVLSRVKDKNPQNSVRALQYVESLIQDRVLPKNAVAVVDGVFSRPWAFPKDWRKYASVNDAAARVLSMLGRASQEDAEAAAQILRRAFYTVNTRKWEAAGRALAEMGRPHAVEALSQVANNRSVFHRERAVVAFRYLQSISNNAEVMALLRHHARHDLDRTRINQLPSITKLGNRALDLFK